MTLEQLIQFLTPNWGRLWETAQIMYVMFTVASILMQICYWFKTKHIANAWWAAFVPFLNLFMAIIMFFLVAGIMKYNHRTGEFTK